MRISEPEGITESGTHEIGARELGTREIDITDLPTPPVRAKRGHSDDLDNAATFTDDSPLRAVTRTG